MAQFGRFRVPPLRATINVAWETLKSSLPDTAPCVEAVRGGAEKVRFARFGGRPPPQPLGESTELYTMPGGGGGDQLADGAAPVKAEESFGYQRSDGGGSFSSVDFGGEGGGGEGGGSKHKISEWQAAWNVTNAIQVS